MHVLRESNEIRYARECDRKAQWHVPPSILLRSKSKRERWNATHATHGAVGRVFYACTHSNASSKHTILLEIGTSEPTRKRIATSLSNAYVFVIRRFDDLHFVFVGYRCSLLLSWYEPSCGDYLIRSCWHLSDKKERCKVFTMSQRTINFGTEWR